MSIDQANIRMLRALQRSFASEAAACGDDRNALLLSRTAKAYGEAADHLEQNPIRLPGEDERLDKSD